MKKKFTTIESRGLPGGPNEQFTYITGVFSIDGYKSDSPDVNNPFNIIPSGDITTKGVDFDLIGMDNLGNVQYMKPDRDYEFPGDMVFEVPAMKLGGGGRCWPGFTPVPGKKAYSKGSCRRASDGMELPMAQFGWFKDLSENLNKRIKRGTDILKEDIRSLGDYIQGKQGFVPDMLTDNKPTMKQLRTKASYLSPKNWEYVGKTLPNYNEYNSFDDAFEAARSDLGKQQFFLYDGKRHSTNYRGETADPETKEILGTLKEGLTPEQYKIFEDVWIQSHQPNLSTKPDTKDFYVPFSPSGIGFDDLPDTSKGRRPHVNILDQNETVYQRKHDNPKYQALKFLDELVHSIQLKDKGTAGMLKDLILDSSMHGSHGAYSTEGTMEHEAHKKMYPELRDYFLGTGEKPDFLNKSQDGGATISQYEEPAWYEKAVDYLASPMTALGYTARNQDLPDSLPINVENRNTFDTIIDAVNPFAWAKYAASAKRNLDQGEYLDAGFDALGAIPIVPAWLAKGKNVAKNLPVDKLDDLVEVVTANGSVKKIPRKDAIKLSRVEDANVTNTSFTDYEDGNWFEDKMTEFYINRTKNAMNPGGYLYPEDPRRLITMYMDPSDAKNFNVVKGTTTERALNMSGGMGNMPHPNEYVIPPALVKQIRETGKIPGASTFIGDANQVMKNLSDFYKKYGGDISELDKKQLGGLLKQLKPYAKKGLKYLDDFIKNNFKEADNAKNFEFKTLPGIESKQLIKVVDGQFSQIDYQHLIPTADEISDIAKRTRERLLTDKFIKNNMKATGNSRDEIIGYVDDFVKEFENSVLQFGKLAPDTGGLYSRGKITIDPTNPYITKNKVLGTLEHEIEHMFSDAARQGSDLYKHPVFKLVDRTGKPDEALVKNISQPFEQQVRFRKALSWLEKNAGLKPGGNVTDDQVKKLTDAITNWSKEAGEDFAGKGGFADVQHLFSNLDANQFLKEGQYLLPNAKQTADITKPNVRQAIKDMLNKTYAALPIVGAGTAAATQEYQDGGEKTLNFDNILDYIVDTRGGDRDTWGAAADTIAFHESSPWYRMDPRARQYPSGPGRGLFQFEGPSLETAQKRYKNIAKAKNFNIDPAILNVKSADELTAEQQYTLFFANLIESKATLSDFAKGELSLEDLWLQGHKNVEKPGDRESFLESKNAAEKEGIKGGYISFKPGGELSVYDVYKKYVMGGANDEVSKDIYDRLNRIHYMDAKSSGMSVPNYILTHMIKSS